MPGFSTPAILIRRIDHGDFDLIITFFSLTQGKTTVIAKNAKKSRKRFAGILELFSLVQIVLKSPKRGGLPVLLEASLQHPFSNIRGNVHKMAYASYWAEILNIWLEEKQAQPLVFQLFRFCLKALDADLMENETVSIIFQIRFLLLAGLFPNFAQCAACRIEVENINTDRFFFDLEKGSILCQGCSTSRLGQFVLSRGTLKQLLWARDSELTCIARLKFSRAAVSESLKLVEAFIPYHLGREPRSLKFLRELRSQGHAANR